MIILRIEHEVSGFEGWKRAFDSDPINRKQSGVQRYRIFQLKEDPNYVVIHLEFEDVKNAEAAVAALHKLWGNVEGKLVFNPKTQILEMVESAEC